MAFKTLPDQAYLRECFDYDPATGVLRWRHRPPEHFPLKSTHYQARSVCERSNAKVAGKPVAYANSSRKGSHPRLVVILDKTPWKAHRVIWKWMTGDDVPLIDHKNRDSLDNRWDNLRVATVGQNGANSKGRKGRVLPRGVTQRHGKWQAKYAGRSLGVFATCKEAAAACEAEIFREYGEFAHHCQHGAI